MCDCYTFKEVKTRYIVLQKSYNMLPSYLHAYTSTLFCGNNTVHDFFTFVPTEAHFILTVLFKEYLFFFQKTLPKLYRLLSDDDILIYGLVAKNPNDRQISVAEHVANSSGGGQSRYISTCSTLDRARHFRYLKTRGRFRYRNGRTDIAEIDVATLPMGVTIIDLRTSIDREIYELQHGMAIKERFHKFADAHSEVLLVGRVPPECLTLT